MPIPNSDSVPREFMPGMASGADSTGAPGSRGAAGDAADNASAGPVSIPMIGSWQSTSRYDADTSGTMQAGQTDASVISPGPAADYADTGAGDGRAGHWKRYDWQQPDGRA